MVVWWYGCSVFCCISLVVCWWLAVVSWLFDGFVVVWLWFGWRLVVAWWFWWWFGGRLAGRLGSSPARELSGR